MVTPNMANPGILHHYGLTTDLVAFEHTPPSRTLNTPPPLNTLLFIGGLSNGLLSVKYVKAIASALPSRWRVVEVLLSSSYEGWRNGSLDRDVRELTMCVRYFKELGDGNGHSGKVVLMGHSTGCQDIMHYLVGPHGAAVDGAIFQGGVSDREDPGIDPKAREILVKEAEKWIDEGRGDECMPRQGHVLVQKDEPQVSAYRTWSLLAVGGDDDYFSSDLDKSVLEKTFGRVGEKIKRVMFLLGERDPHVPASVDKEELIRRWTSCLRDGGVVVDEENGGVVKGGSHSFNGDGEGVVGDLVGRVVGFVAGREG